MSSIWSEERREKFAIAWRAGDRPAEILDALNRLPGPPFTSNKQLSDAARKRRIRRPDWYKALLGQDNGEDPLWTASRLAILVVDWPGGVSSDEILDKLNALAGKQFTAIKQVAHKAHRLKITRPEGFKVPSPMWSPERDALLKRLYCAGHPNDETIIELNKLPGLTIVKRTQLADRAKLLGIRKPADCLEKQRAEARAKSVEVNKAKQEANPPKPKPVRVHRTPLKAELRVIYNHGFQLWQDGYLPVSKRNDVDAINKAIRRAIPGHPGFQLVSKWWAA